MKKNEGITLVTLAITIVVMMILAAITTYVGTDLIREVKLQDLRTDMLLIQAEAKKDLEEYNFQTANVTDETKKSEIKTATLKGISIESADVPTEITSFFSANSNLKNSDTTKYNYYYLSTDNLSEIGLGELGSAEDYGYFIIEYNFTDVKVEVINTKGYQGKYTLNELNQLSEEQEI